MTTFYTLGAHGTESAINNLRGILAAKISCRKRDGIKERILSICAQDAVYDLAWDWSGDEPLHFEVKPDGLHTLSFSGEAVGTPLAALEQLSLQRPEIEWWLSAMTEQENYEYWTAKNGCVTPIDIYSRWIREGVVITFVRGGEELIPPEIDGDVMNENGDPITSEQLIKSCHSLHRVFFGIEYPDDDGGALLKAVDEFVKVRAEKAVTRIVEPSSVESTPDGPPTSPLSESLGHDYAIFSCAPEGPLMVLLDPNDGYQVSVPAQYLAKWVDLPEGDYDSRVEEWGKAWFYVNEEDQIETIYSCFKHDGILYIDVDVGNQWCDRRTAVDSATLKEFLAANGCG